MAAQYAVDKLALSKAFYAGKVAPVSVPSGPGLPGYVPDFKIDYSPEKAKALLAESGYSPAKPVKVKLYCFNGIFVSDFDLSRAIVEMWKKVGIDADLQVVEVAQYYQMELTGTQDAPMVNYWTNGSGDPETFTGVYLNPYIPFASWKSPDVADKINPLFEELDYDKRIEDYRKFDVWAVEQGYSFPLLQGITTAVYSKKIKYKPFKNGLLLPYYWSLI
jgi:peptide/nickel transport system substrate-binding protein